MNRFENKVWLSSPTMHGEELKYMTEAYNTNWMSTVGENIDVLDQLIIEKVGCKYAVPISTGTAALHLSTKLAGEMLYGARKVGEGSLCGHKVFCSDMTFAATVNPVAYENGEAVFIDSETETWNMDPVALEKAFEIYPDVRLVILVHLYGTPAKIDEIRAICQKHNAMLIEDSAESFGATYKGKQTGTFGDFSIISFNGNKIITGTSGGMFLTDNKDAAEKVRKWSNQSREPAAWYEHAEIGYNYRMSNVIAGVVRGQLPHLEEHIAQKKAIYMRYREGLKGLPVSMNPYDAENSEPNFWLSCMTIDKEALGSSTPAKILDSLAEMNAEGRPIWKPMHMQPIYTGHDFVTAQGHGGFDVDADIFARGLCLPSDNKMTPDQQDAIIQAIKDCFK